MSAYLPELLFWLPRLLARHLRQRHTAVFVQEFTRHAFFYLRQFQRNECAEEAELARHFRDRIGGEWNAQFEPVSSNDALDWYRNIVRCNEDIIDYLVPGSCDPVILASYASDLLPWQSVCYHSPCLPLYRYFAGVASLTAQDKIRRVISDALICERIREWKL